MATTKKTPPTTKPHTPGDIYVHEEKSYVIRYVNAGMGWLAPVEAPAVTTHTITAKGETKKL